MIPSKKYQQLITSGQLKPDFAQLAVIEKLDILYNKLFQQSNHSLSNKLASWLDSQDKQGLYLWGDVGSGKSLLIKLFIDCTPAGTALSQHYHQFMRDVQQQLTELQGQRNPLDIVAKHYAQQYQVIFLDEFMITDIGDAMTLSNLLAAFVKNGIIFLTTSNTEPNQLNKNLNLQKQFQPTIDLIYQHQQVIYLDTKTDYRIQPTMEVTNYFYPINDATWQLMHNHFNALKHSDISADCEIFINQRPIKIIQHSDSLIWFDFMDLCGIPRSQQDYLELTKRYHTFFVSGLHQLEADQTNLVRSFVKLIDVLYDQKIMLIIQAAGPIETIYPQGRLVSEFKRTISRINQMQSSAWGSL